MRRIATVVPIVVSILIIIIVSIPLATGAIENIYTYFAGLAGLIGSWIGLYSSVIRPVLRKPAVKLEPVTSTVVFEPEEGFKTYLRMRVTNVGLTAAKNCVGRILELRDEENKQIQFDPLYFFWARQNDDMGYRPVTIYSGDSEFLDIARISHKYMNLKLRISTLGQSLPDGIKYMPIRQYFVKVAIYADDMSPFQAWYQIKSDASSLKDTHLQLLKEPGKKK